VDEAQDTNPIQRALLRKLTKQNTRIIAVGDPAQSIYGFRGASVDALDQLQEEFSMVRLPLSVTYRCPTSVVNKAHDWVTEIQAAPGAPEGITQELNTEWDAAQFKAGDLIVCRTTKPILFLGFHMLKRRMPVRIMGKDIGTGLKKLIEKMRAGSIDDLESKLTAYTAREVEKAIAKQLEEKAANIQDKCDAICTMIEGLDEDNRSIYALTSAIDAMFNDNVNAPVLSTIHKAKGLEADTVYWLNSSQCPSRWARRDWQQQQERNLCYVAVTRAKKELYMIEEKQK
jgi:DNA helicase-2/ATP-dependent DNA helicase PcrA